jgi:hypothetical protein
MFKIVITKKIKLLLFTTTHISILFFHLKSIKHQPKLLISIVLDVATLLQGQ